MRKSLRPSAEDDALEIREIYLLVMGLTGAGKSTFISVVTEDDSIPIGKQEDMDGGECF
jgi:ABC-type proline/glycine betaine transport system ATPase subunit